MVSSLLHISPDFDASAPVIWNILSQKWESSGRNIILSSQLREQNALYGIHAVRIASIVTVFMMPLPCHRIRSLVSRYVSMERTQLLRFCCVKPQYSWVRVWDKNGSKLIRRVQQPDLRLPAVTLSSNISCLSSTQLLRLEVWSDVACKLCVRAVLRTRPRQLRFDSILQLQLFTLYAYNIVSCGS